jgi:tetratricopeptide (TPR) repeat protein
MTTPTPQQQVRCYSCGAWNPRSAENCTLCGLPFRGMCDCGATFCLFDDECPACGAAQVAKQFPLSRHPAVRAGAWSALVLVLGAAAWIAVGPRAVPAWRVRDQALSAYARGDFDIALEGFEQVARELPRDAPAWHMQAACCVRLRMSRDVVVALAEKAVALRPGLVEARTLLARAELDAGSVERAREHAAAAASAPGATPQALVLLAEVEMRRPRPDLALAYDRLLAARARGYDGADAKMLLADVCLRLHGGASLAPTLLPPAAAAALRDAEAVMPREAPDAQAGARGVALARVQLALGRAEDAYESADVALRRLPEDAPREPAVRLLLVRGAAVHARGNLDEALRDFAAALRRLPDAATAAAVVAYLSDMGLPQEAEDLLAAASRESEQSAAIHAVLAGVLLARGAHDDAARAIAAARSLRPDDAQFAVMDGDVQRARGDLDAARSAYALAESLAPKALSPKLHRALLALEGASPAVAGGPVADAVLADLEALRREFGDDGALLVETGRLALAAGRASDARAAFERAVQVAPSEPAAWLGLAESVRRGGGDGAARDLIRAVAHASAARPRDARIAAADAAVRLALGDAPGALTVCSQHLRLSPQTRAILELRARTYAALELWEGAAGDLRKLADMGPADPGVLVRLVHAQFRAGRGDAARRTVADARKLLPAEVASALESAAALPDKEAAEAVRRIPGHAPADVLGKVASPSDLPAIDASLYRLEPGHDFAELARATRTGDVCVAAPTGAAIDVDVVHNPEPSAFALFGAAGLALGALVLRRRRARAAAL